MTQQLIDKIFLQDPTAIDLGKRGKIKIKDILAMKLQFILPVRDANKSVGSTQDGTNLLQREFYNYRRQSGTNLTPLICVNQNKIGNIGCKYLSRIHLPKIEEMHLGSNQIESEGILHLSKRSYIKLHELSLSENKIGINSFLWIMRAKWPNLSSISFGWNKVTLKQLRNLILSETLFLTDLYLVDNQIIWRQSEEIRQIQRRFGVLKIKFLV